jgi:biopolymer transport protein ExbB/TolQ
MQPDIVVNAVMVGLAFASLVTWTIWLARGLDLAASRRCGARSPKGGPARVPWPI